MNKKTQYQFFPTTALKPTGWLKKQLRLQADGLCGNLDKVWKDVRDSAWIGGDSDGWERVPYWLDGFIPLAYLLEDADLISRAQKYVDAILDRQQADGWICPCEPQKRAGYDPWPVLLITKVLCVYYDCTADTRAMDAVYLCLKQFNDHIDVHLLSGWGAARWFEGLVALGRLYEARPEPWMLTLAQKLRAQGLDWREMLHNDFLDSFRGWNFMSHIVNIAMMLKSDALYSLFFGGDPQAFADEALAYLDRRHRTAAGHFNGDEILCGNSPIQGAELCSVVEAMYSYEILFAVTGDVKFLDRLEELAFNSLPATISPDMWTHQYNQMSNQVACFPMSEAIFRTNDRQSHLFGLEPNFGCCTANFGQGWPKFALSTFLRAEHGVASCALAPATLQTEIDGVGVTCALETDYPFRDVLTYRVTTEQPVEFTLSVRIPATAAAAEIDGVPVPCGSFAHLLKTWSGTQTVTVRLRFETQILPRPQALFCVKRGPLLYAVPIREEWERVEYTANGVERKFPYCDYYIFPRSKWNYMLTSDDFTVEERAFDQPFRPDAPPIVLTAQMCEVDWGFHNGHCDRLPADRTPRSDPQPVEMIPYGCTNLRMTEIPFQK